MWYGIIKMYFFSFYNNIKVEGGALLMGMNLKKVVVATAVLSATISSTAFAGTWSKGTGENQNKWWYDKGNGSYSNNGWEWIDNDGDGTAESYYFDNNGWLLVNTTTPDGYTVNENGAWVINGVIQTKSVTTSVAPISESDFIVSGNNSVTQNNADHSIITNWKRLGYDLEPYHSFVMGDSITTARDITFGASKSMVMEKYGNVEASAFSKSDKWYQKMLTNSLASATNDINIIEGAVSVLEYSSNPYGIRFYFNQQDQLIAIMYYNESNLVNSNIKMADYVGKFAYCGACSYIFNEQNMQYEVFAETKSSSYDEWFHIYPADLACLEYDISYATDEKVILNGEFAEDQYLKYNGIWYYYQNKDGVLQDSEKEYAADIEFLEGGKIAFNSEWYIDSENSYGWPENSYLKVTAFYQKK